MAEVEGVVVVAEVMVEEEAEAEVMVEEEDAALGVDEAGDEEEVEVVAEVEAEVAEADSKVELKSSSSHIGTKAFSLPKPKKMLLSH